MAVLLIWTPLVVTKNFSFSNFSQLSSTTSGHFFCLKFLEFYGGTFNLNTFESKKKSFFGYFRVSSLKFSLKFFFPFHLFFVLKVFRITHWRHLGDRERKKKFCDFNNLVSIPSQSTLFVVMEKGLLRSEMAISTIWFPFLRIPH